MRIFYVGRVFAFINYSAKQSSNAIPNSNMASTFATTRKQPHSVTKDFPSAFLWERKRQVTSWYLFSFFLSSSSSSFFFKFFGKNFLLVFEISNFNCILIIPSRLCNFQGYTKSTIPSKDSSFNGCCCYSARRSKQVSRAGAWRLIIKNGWSQLIVP